MSEEEKREADRLSNLVIGAAIEVHRFLRPGLLESAYEACLCHELADMNLSIERQKPLPVVYKGLTIDCAYKMDLVVNDLVIIEIKSVDQLARIHDAQLLSYLKLSQKWLGLLINFSVRLLKEGIKRLVNG